MNSAELLPVGGSYCLFRRDTHAAALLNPNAAALAEAILAGEDDSDLAEALAAQGMDRAAARRHVAALAEALSAGGFVAAEESARSAARHPGSLIEPAPGWWEGRYHIRGSRAYRLVCEDAALARLLEAALEPLRVHSSSSGDGGNILVTGYGGAYAVLRDGVRIASGLALPEARRIAIQALMMALLPRESVSAILHASAVATGNSAIVLSGATGSGKTTLTLHLVARGARYLADDLLPLSDTGLCTTPFPVAASVKEGSWPIVERDFPQLADVEVHRAGERNVRYLDPRAVRYASDSDPIGIRLLLFPRYERDACLQMSRLTPEDTLGRFLGSGTEIVSSPRTIRPLARLVDETPAFELVFSDLGAAARLVGKVAGTP